MKTNAVSITLYDLQGQMLDPKIVKTIEQCVENLARAEKSLAINIAKS